MHPVMVLIWESTSHIFPVNDHNDIDQNWDYISFLMFIGIKELLQICDTAGTINLEYLL